MKTSLVLLCAVICIGVGCGKEDKVTAPMPVQDQCAALAEGTECKAAVDILQAVAIQAEAAFEVFMDLVLGLPLEGQEGVLIARTARYIHHPELKQLLPAIARSRNAETREAIADLWTYRPEIADLPTLATLMVDPSVPVRRATARAWASAGRFDMIETMLADPDPGIRLDLALGLRSAPSAPSLDGLLADPDDMVRATAFVIRLLRGDLTQRPADFAISRPAAATAVRLAASDEELRKVAQGERTAARRLPAALALAVLDDEAAYEIMRNDPAKTVRDQVGRMLKGWELAS